MHRRTILSLSLAALVVGNYAQTAHAFGSGSKDASVQVIKGGTFKGQSTLAIGAFRVAFVTDDSALSTSSGMFSGGFSSTKMNDQLIGVDHAMMQKIADEVYADFVKQAAAKGFTVVDSVKVAEASSAYRDMVKTDNFASSRIGTLVIPTGQHSVAMPADDSHQDAKGARTMTTAFHNLGKINATSPADKAFPTAAKDVGSPVIGVTIVVNFLNFKVASSSFGTSRVTIEPGITIDGTNKTEITSFTSILAWDAKSCDHVGCMAQVVLQGELHSNEPIGKATLTGKNDYKFGNAKGNTVLDADPELYEKNALAMTAQTSDMLLTAMSKEK